MTGCTTGAEGFEAPIRTGEIVVLRLPDGRNPVVLVTGGDDDGAPPDGEPHPAGATVRVAWILREPATISDAEVRCAAHEGPLDAPFVVVATREVAVPTSWISARLGWLAHPRYHIVTLAIEQHASPTHRALFAELAELGRWSERPLVGEVSFSSDEATRARLTALYADLARIEAEAMRAIFPRGS